MNGYSVITPLHLSRHAFEQLIEDFTVKDDQVTKENEGKCGPVSYPNSPSALRDAAFLS